MDVISIINASFGYDEAAVFEGINLELHEGEILCLFGPNGCGKTTLLDTILGHLALTSGNIMIAGKPQHEYSSRELAQKIAYVPQVHEKPFPYRVIDVVVMGRTPHLSPFASPSGDDFETAARALDAVGITHLKDRPYTRLSGGETQLVILARALAQEARIILMDEPASHLDFRHELALLETVASLVRDRGMSVMMATHSPNHALYFENGGVPVRIAVMNEKRLVHTGRPGKVLTGTNIGAIYGIRAVVLETPSEEYGALKYIMPLSILKKEK